MYNVLWFDDEHEVQEEVKDEFKEREIKLIAYSNADEGIAALLENPKHYDAILLDGLFYNSLEHVNRGVSEEAFGKVAKTILTLKTQGIILPMFIYSGEKSWFKGNNTLVNIFKDENFADGKVFEKNNDKDLIELCDIIKESANQQPYTRARQEYPYAFKPFEDGILERKHEHLLLDIIVCYYKGDFRKKNVNVQRDLLEAIWKSLHFSVPCIPERFFDKQKNNKPNHEWCTLFFENRTVEIKVSEGNKVERHRIKNNVSKAIGSYFRGLKESLNELSHLSDDEVVKLEFTTNTFLLINVLVWLSEFAEQNYTNYI